MYNNSERVNKNTDIKMYDILILVIIYNDYLQNKCYYI